MTTPTFPAQYGFGAPDTAFGLSAGMLAVDFYDYRSNVTATDSSAIALHVVPAPGHVYACDVSVVGYAGTVSAAHYVLSWTVNTAVQTATITITSVAANATSEVILTPDTGSTVTAQLTTLTGGLAAVNVACISRRVL